MSQEQFTALEQSIETLIQRYESLKSENAELKQKLERLNAAHAELKQSKEQAAQHVKRIIAQLKEQSQ